MMRYSAFIATIISSVNFVASSAFAAYHDALMGGGSIGAVLPIVVAVVLGMVGLWIWDRKKPKTKSKRKHKHKRR